MITQFRKLLGVLNSGGIEYIVIGGVAAVLHGSARVTYDLDVLYRRHPDNLARIIEALRPYNPYLRGAVPGLPFLWDVETLRRGLNFTLQTAIGAIDLLAEVPGGGTYELAWTHSLEVRIQDVPVRVVSLEKLIELKRAAGRPKDFESIAELESLREAG
jgi:hypothetical protein